MTNTIPFHLTDPTVSLLENSLNNPSPTLMSGVRRILYKEVVAQILQTNGFRVYRAIRSTDEEGIPRVHKSVSRRRYSYNSIILTFYGNIRNDKAIRNW